MWLRRCSLTGPVRHDQGEGRRLRAESSTAPSRTASSQMSLLGVATKAGLLGVVIQVVQTLCALARW